MMRRLAAIFSAESAAIQVAACRDYVPQSPRKARWHVVEAREVANGSMARSITDEEIALIKAMLARGMKNADIQFFFNRPGRHVNSGRITNIADGTYSNSANIPPATDESLNAFLAARSPTTDVPTVFIGAATGNTDPVSDTVLRAMFEKDAAGECRLRAGETDTAECKKSFSLKHAAPWLRAVAALANNRGGYVFFGVADKDDAGVCKAVGLTGMEFRDADPGDITARLQSAFQPTPRTAKAVVEIDGKPIGVLHVERHESRPVIATKNDGGGGEIKEGDIFHRYPGASRRISYGDLRAMLDERDVRVREAILPMVQRLLEIGPDRAMIADLASGKLTDGKTSIELSEDIVERLAVIKEGEFEEKAGAPALRLIGDVKAAAPITIKKGSVTRDDLRRDFLNDALQADPKDYLRTTVDISSTEWMPLRFFAIKGGMSRDDLRSFIESANGSRGRKDLLINRIGHPDKAYVKVSGPAAQIQAGLLNGAEVTPSTATEARAAALAVAGLQRPFALEAAKLRALLLRCLDLTMSGGGIQIGKSEVRKAIARLDELLSPW